VGEKQIRFCPSGVTIDTSFHQNAALLGYLGKCAFAEASSCSSQLDSSPGSFFLKTHYIVERYIRKCLPRAQQPHELGRSTKKGLPLESADICIRGIKSRRE
jgi:hypothetical protein